MNPKKEIILITGSSGLIGSALINFLADKFTLIGFDSGNKPHPPANAECICADLTSDESVDAAFNRVRFGYGNQIRSVVHLAAYYSFSGDPSPLYEKVTVKGTQRMLRHLQEFDVGQFIFSSSMLVHAPCAPGEHIKENWPLQPKWDYPRSKVQTEELIHAMRSKIPAVILRVAGVYDDQCHSIPIAHQIQRIYERKLTSHFFPGDTSHGQSFIHLDDLLNAISLTISHRENLETEWVALLGEEDPMSYEEIQKTSASFLHGESWKTVQIPKDVAKAGAWLLDKVPGEEAFIKPWMIDMADDHYALDTTRAKTALGWSPAHSLRETMPLILQSLLDDPAEWYRINKLALPSRIEKRKT